MCCMLCEEPRIDEDEVVRLTAASDFWDAHTRYLALVRQGIRCRVVDEHVASESDKRGSEILRISAVPD